MLAANGNMEEVVSTNNPMAARTPLMPTENNDTNNGDLKRKPRVKHVASRYLLPSSSNSTKPTTTCTTISVCPPSSSRPKTAVPNSRPGNVSPAASKLLSTSTRSLSVSFQGDTFSLPVSKAKEAYSRSLRNRTPDQRPWPGKRTQENLHLGDREPPGTDRVQGIGNGSRVVSSPVTAPRGLVVSSKFLQDTNSRLRHLQNPRTSPASPNKPLVASRGNFKYPNGICTDVNFTNSDAPSSTLSFSVDLGRVNKGENCIANAHTLRLLYNRYLQWRFVNARTNATIMAQKLSAEKYIWNAFITITEGRRSVTVKRKKLLLLRQKLKLVSILKEQMIYLEDWGFLEKEYSSSLLAANDALKEATSHLPIAGNTLTDIQGLKDAICTAVDVMQAISSTICSLLSKVEEVKSLLAELVNVTSEEQFSLDQCSYFLRIVAGLQVHDCSLRTDIIQLSHTGK